MSQKKQPETLVMDLVAHFGLKPRHLRSICCLSREEARRIVRHTRKRNEVACQKLLKAILSR
jgi:hypothetical protein